VVFESLVVDTRHPAGEFGPASQRHRHQMPVACRDFAWMTSLAT
jgi:hypothetical protein